MADSSDPSSSDEHANEDGERKKEILSKLFENRKTSKQTLEDVKRKGREERAREREEKKKVQQETESNDEEDYYVQQLSAMSISVQKPEKSLGLFGNGQNNIDVEKGGFRPPWSQEDIQMKPLNIEYFGTGLVYDELMLKHRNLWDTKFPEKPERISEPFKRCCELRLVERCVRIEKQYGTEDMVLLKHTQEMLEKVKSTSQMNIEQLKSFCQQYDSIYCSKDTYEAALVSLGSVMELMEQILKKKITNGLAIVRPPGHHAMNNTLCGFCIFNNVAIAAKHAIDNLGVKKILIVDWDVHHGQATQQMFYDDPRVLYFSIHRYEYGEYWPHLRESDYDYIGKDKGLGYNINVPLNKKHMTDADYLAIFHHVLMPVAYQFCPDLILVSAGYDCAIGCPEFCPDLVLVSSGYDAAIGDHKGEMMVSPAAFGHMTHHLMLLSDGRVCVCLEGGYCIKSLSESVALTLKALLRDPCPLLKEQEEPSDSIRETILNVIKVLRPHWTCFLYQDLFDEDVDDPCPDDYVYKMPPKPGINFITEENSPKVFPLAYTYPEEVEEIYHRQKKFDPIIDQLIGETQLMRPPYRTCIVYDDDMRAHKADYSWGHPEDPDRITRIFDKHVEWGLVERCLRVQSRHASEAELQLIHSSKYIEEMKNLSEKSVMDLRQLAGKYNSIFLNQETYNCALLATGCLLNVVHTVLTGEASSGVAVVRPPGHHAECTTCMGFCFFNSVAVAAKYAQQKFGLKRILILDWDVHHGNGTQHQFFEDSSVLLINLHRYDNGFFYPTSTDGSELEVGTGQGEGYNVNIAWNYGYMGDAEYIAAFQQIVMPIAYEFAPELVLVSAGFDSAVGDPLGHYLISPVGYAHMTHMLSGLANGRVVLSLEGGYNLVSISHSMCMCTSVLLGDPCPSLQISVPKDSAIKTIKNVIDVHKKYWKCLKFREKIPDLCPKEEVTDKTAETESKPSATNLTDQPSGHQVTEEKPTVTNEEEETKLNTASASATKSTIAGLDVISDKVVIPLDDYPSINFIQIIRRQQKTLETETNTKLFLRGEALETRGLDPTEKILYVYVYSNLRDNVKTAVQKINEIIDREISSYTNDNRTGVPEITTGVVQQTTGVQDTKTSADLDTLSKELQSLSVSQSSEKPQMADSGSNSDPQGASGGNLPQGQEERPNTYSQLLEQMESKGVEQMFAVNPLTWCPHLETVTPLPEGTTFLDTSAPCETCGDTSENWICLVCYKVFCSRFVNENMLMHGIEAGHLMCLSYSDLSVWCYGCDQYVHNEVLKPAKNAAHVHKFGEPLP